MSLKPYKRESLKDKIEAKEAARVAAEEEEIEKEKPKEVKKLKVKGRK